MMSKLRLAALVATAGLACPALAQDSVGRNADGGNGLPGDAMVPTETSGAVVEGGSQAAAYTLHTDIMFGSWGTALSIGPVLKASAVDPGSFFSSLVSGQAFSQYTAYNVPFTRAMYADWTKPGEGVNPNAAKNVPAAMVPAPGPTSNRMAISTAEFGTDSAGFTYNGMAGAFINSSPRIPRTLWVERIPLASSQRVLGDAVADNAVFGNGAIDENGNAIFRADNNATAGPFPIEGNNIFRIRMQDRNSGGETVNWVEDNGVGGDGNPVWGDPGSTNADPIVENRPDPHSVPTIIPASVFGGTGCYIGPNFLSQIISGPNQALLNPPDGGHIVGPGASQHRGSMPHIRDNLPFFAGSVNGTTAILTRGGSSASTDNIALFGLNALGFRSGPAFPLVLPAAISDPCNGVTIMNFGAQWHLDHYHSQTAFNGPTSLQVALGTDPFTGHGVAAGVAYLDALGTGDNPINALVVNRFDPANLNSNAWELVGYLDPTAPFGIGPSGNLRGTPIDGDFGNDGIAFTGDPGEFDGVVDIDPLSPTFDAPIGWITTLDDVTGIGNPPIGPSISGPAFDSAGNVYFIASVELNKFDSVNMIPIQDLDSALLRGIYLKDCDLTTPGDQPGWRLELMLELGDTFDSQNVSGVTGNPLRYQIQFMGTADSNSVSSGTLGSHNVSKEAYNGLDPRVFSGKTDPRVLAGMVVSVGIVYDTDEDGDFTDPTGASSDPGSADEAYNVQLFLGSLNCLADMQTTGAAAADPDFGVPDGTTDLSDLLFYVNVWNSNLGPVPAGTFTIADLTTTGAAPGSPNEGRPDGQVDLADLLFFVNIWNGCL